MTELGIQLQVLYGYNLSVSWATFISICLTGEECCLATLLLLTEFNTYYYRQNSFTRSCRTESLSFWLPVDWRLPELLEELESAPTSQPCELSQHSHILPHISMESL